MPACPNCGRDNPEGFQFCPSCGAAMAGPAPPPEERKLVTVLFADVTGSTALGEQLDPERLRALLNTYFSAMSSVIESWGGTVEKFIGDAVMAAFGVPIVREDDAARALRASLDMLARLEDLNRDFGERHGVTVQIRIGVNTGEVIAPTGGAVAQMIVAGDAVNVAARLEGAAEPGTVLVGERTYLAARNAFRFGDPVALDLKGKTEAVTARRLIEPLPESTRGVPGLHSPMVGRDRELDALVGLLEDAVETARPRLVVLYGPAGIGKSRLVQEFVRVLSLRHSKANVLRGRCPAAGRGITYWPLGEILRSACGISLDDPVDVAQGRLRTAAGRLLAALRLSPAELDQTVQALAKTAGIPLPDNPLDRLEPQAVADELAQAWPRFATAAAARDPAVFVLEDLHWAEDRLLEMLQRMLARSAGPLLILATARPEFAESHPSFAAGREDSSSISLRPLTDEQSRSLVDSLLALAELPDQLREELLAKAEGNPFYLEELIRRLIDEGALIRRGDRWTATDAARATLLPDTIQGLLAARIDTLAPEEKRVLQEASVVGRVFWEEPVARSMGDGEVSGALLGLERKGLVFARPTSAIAGQVEFMFKHALVRDVAYASLPKARRARAHAEHAGWIEELAGDRRDEFAELVAHHYFLAAAGEDADLAWADDPAAREAIRTRAFDALIAAGATARRRFALPKAVELHRQALDLSASDAERAQALEDVGDDHFEAFHGEDAVEAYRRSLEVLPPDTDRANDRARLLMKMARMYTGRSGAFRTKPEPVAIDRIILDGLEVATEPSVRGWLLASRGAIVELWPPTTDPVPLEDRLSAVREARLIAERLDDPDLLTFLTATLSDLYWAAGDYSQAVEAARREVDLLDRFASVGHLSSRLVSPVARLIEMTGEYEDGLELVRRAYVAARERSDHERMHGSALIIEALFYLGRWKEIFPVLEEHLAAFEQESDVGCGLVRGGPVIGALALSQMGELERGGLIATMVPFDLDDPGWPEGIHTRFLVAAGHPEEARTRAESILAINRRAPDAAIALLESLATLGEWAALDAFLPSARDLAASMALVGPSCDRAQGLLAESGGKGDEAVRAMRSALEGFEQLAVPFEAARTREALARLSAPETARALLTQALRTYEALDARPHADRVRAILHRET